MTSSKWFKMFIVAGVVVIGVFWLWQRQENTLLRQNNEALVRQLKQLEQGRNEISVQTNQATDTDASISRQRLIDLLRLRNEVGMLRRQTNDMRQMQQDLEQLRSAATTAASTGSSDTKAQKQPLAVYPKTNWVNVGYSTPEDAFQTINWAALNGDLAAIRTALTAEMQKDFDKEAGNKIENQFAEEIKEMFRHKAEVRILSKSEVTDGLVVLEVDDTESASGKQGSADKLVFQLIDGVWKLAADH